MDTNENLRRNTCQVCGVGPKECVFVHAGLADHLQEPHTVWNHTAQVLQTQAR